MAASSIRITQRRSASGEAPKVRATLHSLGLRGIGRTVEARDGPEVQGMIRAVSHLVEVSDGESPSAESERADG